MHIKIIMNIFTIIDLIHFLKELIQISKEIPIFLLLLGVSDLVGSLQKLETLEQNEYKLREFDSLMQRIESGLKCFHCHFLDIIIVHELDKSRSIATNIIIFKEMHNILIADN